MTLQSSTIFIDQLHLYAFHGVMEQERRVGAEYVVDARVHYYIKEAITSDDVCDTLNYAELCLIVKEQMAQPSKLLEHVAGRICQAICERYPQATAVELKLTKLNPPMGADCSGAGVEVYFTND